LVWKDKQGNLGFGNVAYPDAGHVSVYEEDGWIGVERPAVAPGADSGEAYAAAEGPSPDEVASEASTRYLVWKDKQGNLGFGNVAYPDAGHVSAYEEEGWVGVEKPAVSPGVDAGEAYATAEGPSPDEVASEISTQYLVWKDEHGNLGFGNVAYPSKEDVSYVHVDGKWEKVMN
jgi:hypothetical protein